MPDIIVCPIDNKYNMCYIAKKTWRNSLNFALSQNPSEDYPSQIKRIRAELGFTQQSLAERLGVSFATVNRWENGQTKPSQLSWNQFLKMVDEIQVREPKERILSPYDQPVLDFTSDPDAILALAEGERLSFGHIANPVFATEIAYIDPLPHQRIAVYDNMLRQNRLRFLLADDAGAGKTIMAGLYMREMLSRRLIKRILIAPPAGLVGNWYRELTTLFNLEFKIIRGTDAGEANPFLGDKGDRVIVSIDTLAGPKVFARLKEPSVQPYDLVLFDEAHKLSANRRPDLRIDKTDRYCLAEALAGVAGLDDRWKLSWRAHHLLLLSATPHMGKEYPYYALWRLLEPEMLSTMDAFDQYPMEHRHHHFIRRTKEEMVRLDGTPLYPKRISDTLGYDLSQGEISEQTLYDETTEYLRHLYNRAKLLNREAARLAMSVFQRRLASSTYALMRSFERRIEKLGNIINDIQSGEISLEQLYTLQRRISETLDVLDAKTADDENQLEDKEENEVAEEKLLQGVVAASLGDLLTERDEVKQLRSLAQKVYDAGIESKFEKLQEVIKDQKYAQEKLIIFSEHRDTVDFLVRKLEGMGYTGQVAQIHGGMYYTEREEQVERFRKPASEGGARFLVCTDAAGEGINLQFCWIMINYDIPWNPARLEQRMGRIHRYGQKHDPVIIINLVAPSTREGHVLKILLDKLEKIRNQLKSDKVFDSIGRVFLGLSIKEYMEKALLDGADAVAQEMEGLLTKEQVKAIEEKERRIYGGGGDVAKELPRLRQEMDRDVYFKLLPGYVRHFLEMAAPQVGIKIDGDLSGFFKLNPSTAGSIDPLLVAFEAYPNQQREKLSIERPEVIRASVWFHPGEPVFERFRELVRQKLEPLGLQGAVFIDPTTEKPYLFHLALVEVVRQADPEFTELAREETIETKLVGVKQYEGVDVTTWPVEHLLLLKGGRGLPRSSQRLALAAGEMKDQAKAYLAERVARMMAVEHRRRMIETIPERESFLRRGYNFQEAELAAARAAQSQKARDGNKRAMIDLNEIKEQQRQLAARREAALAVLRREPELIMPGKVTFLAHAIIVPSTSKDDRKRHDVEVEKIAMRIARAFEEAAGAVVRDVHTPDLARSAGLPENPGFDLLSIRSGGEKMSIEVKGRASTGDVEVTANEWAKACNMRDQYWLYAVYDCATPQPRLARVQDPFGALLARAKGGVLIGAKQILEASEA